jgi:archaellum component FlaC
MSNTPIQVTTDLSKVLEQINQKLDTVQKEVTDFRTETKVALESIKGDINVLKGEVSNIKEDVKEVKGSQKAQIWTLIGILGTAVVGTVIRFVITAMPSNP